MQIPYYNIIITKEVSYYQGSTEWSKHTLKLDLDL